MWARQSKLNQVGQAEQAELAVWQSKQRAGGHWQSKQFWQYKRKSAVFGSPKLYGTVGKNSAFRSQKGPNQRLLRNLRFWGPIGSLARGILGAYELCWAFFRLFG